MLETLPYLQNAINLFVGYFPNFSTPKYLIDERDYKVELSQLAQTQLSKAIMAEGIAQENFAELANAAKQIFRHSKNNMPSPQEKTVIGNIKDEQAEPFIRALFDYLHGDSPWAERLAQFAAHFEQITGKKATWPHLTLYPFLMFPEEHIFLKPEAMTKAAEVLGFQWDYQSSPDLNTYQQFQQLTRLLLPELQPLGARDMIDVQSFLWVTAGAAPNCWLFQANPKYYDLVAELAKVQVGDTDGWSVDRYRSEMKAGDVAIFWQSGSAGGIYAIGELIGEPRKYDWEPSQEEIEEQPYLKAGWTVDYKYTTILADQPILREILKTHPILSQMQIIKMPRATVFRVSQTEWRELQKMIDNPISQAVPNTQNNQIVVDALANYVNARGFHFPQTLLTTYYLSLQTKPFVILTGISGTGKTKLAQLFAEWVSPSVEEKTIEKDVPEDSDVRFYLEVKPYYFKSGFVIPVKAYRYFDIPEVNNTATMQVQLKKNGQSTEVKFRHQQHTNGNSYVYFYSNDAVKSWFNANLKAGDILAVSVEQNQVYRFEKFQPTEKKLIKQKPRHVFLSVRPDWTDNRGLLGFYNLISQSYQTTDFLRLLTQAAIEPDAPHFVILDEMNLAKVEYYFADFLSVLESRYIDQNGEVKQEMLRLHDLPRCVLAQGEATWNDDVDLNSGDGKMCQVRCTGCPLRHGVDKEHWLPKLSAVSYTEAQQTGFKAQQYVPPHLAVPVNIYFTGTVNVDETTYMFSPKVLDRANTIEFNEVNLVDYFNSTAKTGEKTSPASETLRQQFTLAGQFMQFPKSIPDLRNGTILASYRQRLAELNNLLAPFTLHFGYRVADEILLYLWHAHNLATPGFDLETAFDHQLYQKILPKFHGSEAKLREPLMVLQTFCESQAYPRSLTKIGQMLDQLDKEGFASFA